jgi:hypothetical protein
MEFEKHMEKRIESRVKYGVTKGVKILFFMVLFLVFALVIGYFFMLLWNWLMPELFGLPLLTYWKAVGVLILAKLLFGFGSSGPSKPGNRSRSRKWRKDCRPASGQNKWQYYDRFWREEGEKAFEEFIRRNEDETASTDSRTDRSQ